MNITERVISVRVTIEEDRGRLKPKDPKSQSGRRMVALESIGAEAIENRLKKAIDEGY